MARAMSTAAKLYVGLDGKPVVYNWGGWEPTPKLRWCKGVLQQEWERFGVSSVGSICAGEAEWREVPTES